MFRSDTRPGIARLALDRQPGIGPRKCGAPLSSLDGLFFVTASAGRPERERSVHGMGVAKPNVYKDVYMAL